MNKDSFILLFQYGELFFSPLFIALGRISSTMLNENDDKGHYCPVLDLRGKALNLSQLNMLIAVQFS